MPLSMPLLFTTTTFILTFLMMMQCATLAAGEEDHTIASQFCRRQKCENGCLALAVTHKTPRTDLIENSFTFTNHENSTTTCVCPSSCDDQMNKNCTVENTKVTIRHLQELKNPEDPCEIFFCNNGVIGIHMAACAAIDCPIQHRIRLVDECCDSCDISMSSFCSDDENIECDRHCRYGYVRDTIRNCDLCKCTVRSTTTTTTTTEESTTTVEVTTIPPPQVDVESEKKIFFFFFTSESDILNVMIICIIVIAVTAFAVFLAFMIWFLHRRIYNRVPLISHGSWKNNNQYA